MKPIVIRFGLISGAILAGMMFVTMPFVDQIGYDMSMVIGYTTMVVAFLFVFFGIRTYRDDVGGGVVSFGRAFKVGILITAIASLCYVATWQLIYFKIAPEYSQGLADKMMAKIDESGASPEVIAAERARAEKFMEMYRNPLFNSAMTLIEVLPVGVIVTLISAAILKRREGMGERQLA